MGEEKEEMRKGFSGRVYRLVKKIPKGKVTTYGRVAGAIGRPKAARAVGNVLHNNPDPKTILCYRVVNREGGLAPRFREQKRRLLKEGVKFRDRVHVDLKKHLWQGST